MKKQQQPAYQIDVCHYCGASYHPMRVYVKEPYQERGRARIYVCDLKIIRDEWDEIVRIEPVTECHDKATAEGWSYSEVLTPRR